VGESDYLARTPLDDLRFHWGSPYLIEYLGHHTWVAQRRDDHATLGADNPEALRDKIRADYLKHPVSCRLSRPAQTGGARSGRGIRLLPEG
jgi:hypothetical protein